MSFTGRSRGAALTGLFLAGGLGLVVGSQTWWRASGGGTRVSFTGYQASGGLTWALAAVLLAGALLALVLRTRGRQVIAVVLALTGLGMVLTGALRQRPTSQGVLDKLSEVTLADSFALTATAWPWVYAGAGLIAVAASLVMLLRAGRWPGRATRFERAAASGEGALADDPAGAWKAMDAGIDPTVETPPPMCNPKPQGTQWMFKVEQTPAASRPEAFRAGVRHRTKDAMSSRSSTPTASSATRPAADQQASDEKPAKHVHHGRTPAAWAGSMLVLLAFIVGGIGFVIPPHPNWIVVIIGAVILVIGLIGTLVLRKLGYGVD